MALTVFTHPVFERHDMGTGHPERPERLAAVREGLTRGAAADQLGWREAPPVERDHLLRVHDSGHVAALERTAPTEGRMALDGDTAMNPYTLEAARRAAGAAVAGVDALLAGETRRVFCAVRPPGHHAEAGRAMGFCFFNNVAVAAARALDQGLSRVAILDFDVHHGNGTEDIFRDEPRVLFCSSFQHPFYPGTPLAERPHLVHSPLSAGAGGAEFRRAVEQQWEPAVDAFQPELILVSAGFDAHAADPLAALNLHEDDFRWVTDRIVAMAEHHAAGRILSTLEGGYDLTALRASAAVHVEGLVPA
jgi:acetoin utilization deacetylase AcuC-like enzyme